MHKALHELLTITILTALIGTPIGLYITGTVQPVAQWGTK